MNECLELQDKTLVRISLYLASQSLIPLPASISIPRISGGPLFSGTPALVLASSPRNNTELRYTSAPTVKTSQSNQQAGVIYAFDVQVPVVLNVDAVQQAVDTVLGKDLHLLLDCSDGSQYLIYALPNTAQPSVDDTRSASPSATLKVALKSCSHLIPVSA